MNNSEKHKVLVVDDTPMNLRALSINLQPDYTVFVTTDGATAIKIAEESMPDIILLDVIMPDMDGYEVLDALKKSDKTKNIPVIFITGLDDNTNEEKGLALGAVDYINKSHSKAVIKLRIKLQLQIADQLYTIEQLNSSLKDALDESKTASLAKSSFLARMSHEIRTPMNAILGITELIMQDASISPETFDGVSRIHSSGDLLLSIINDILDISKIEAGKFELIREEYSLAALLHDTLNMHILRLDSIPVEFSLRLSESLPDTLFGDVLRIKQILNNLLSNAAKYTREGEIVMEVEARSVSRGLSSENDSDIELVFVIRDTGVGMTPDQVSRLFDLYTRFKTESSKATEGTGLGMSITQDLLNVMDGTIHVESEPNVGSVFTVTIPQKRVGENVLDNVVAENLRRLRLEHTDLAEHASKLGFERSLMPYGSVLLVDDTESNLYVAKGLLLPYGLKFETADNGFKAIDIIKSGKVFDVIFMDHMMPNMDGLETVRRIRDLGYDKPIIALTANAMMGQSELFLSCGFDDFLTKPVDIRILDSLLNKWIRDKHPPEAPKAAHLHTDDDYDDTDGQDFHYDLSKQMMDAFAKDASHAINVMESLLKNRDTYTDEDVKLYEVKAHSIKSALTVINEAELSGKALKLEKAALAHDMEFVFSETPAFIDELRAVLDKIS